MKIDVASVRKCLKSFDFTTLFREHLGWDNHQAQLDIPVDGETMHLTAVAQKRGFIAYVCPTIPDRNVRRKVDNQVTKTAREHFVIYADQDAGQQVWQWVRREPGKPIAVRDHRFDVQSNRDALIQRLDQIAVSLDEEEDITIVEVTGRARAAFDVDTVTKKFYDRFKTEHAAFLKFIKGIQSRADLEWYTSLMLNRLMFVYFIQKKGFLDGDTNYLQNRMRRVREIKGKDKFQSFYRYFLLRLFHDGLGKLEAERQLDRDLEKLLGKVPYLDGGFFEVHQLEERNAQIDIPDKAFEKLFAFFDEFSWHLDERPLRAGNEINPDVVGYIFEKYINQKQMGAYYTKEDITEYISKNTIIPFLFDAAKKTCPVAFEPDSFLWRLLRDDPDRYIYNAVRHGVIDRAGQVIALPKEIEAGVQDVAKRGGWNKAAPEPFALPTETWREYVARRQRCLELRDKLAKGEVHQINELITLNLDIWQFARDAIVNSEGPELLRAFWHAMAGCISGKSTGKLEPGVTVLDPTCGSGAFLFAALRILETLYSDCLERMNRFIEDADSGSSPNPIPKEECLSRPSPSGRGDGGEGRASTRPPKPHHAPVPADILEFARKLRKEQTDAEILMWSLLRDRRLAGRKFRRQHPIEPYFLDFYCHELKLAVELDGGQHNTPEARQHDDVRSKFLAEQRIRVLRFWNHDVLRDTEMILEAIWREVAVPGGAPSPPTPLAEGEGSGKLAPIGRGFGDGKKPQRFADFRAILADIQNHPNERYFILNSIVINNLFGVDIMEEAVEICKLRLFLKLVAQVETVDQIEPLPDIDFNIRAGNTLVGYVSLDELRNSQAGTLGFDASDVERIEEDALAVEKSFEEFRAQQTSHGGKVTTQDKQDLRCRLAKLGQELDCYLAGEYGVNVEKAKEFDAWRASHQPFHWLVEFYGIMLSGGFDVIIGNPPYLELSQIDYSPRAFQPSDAAPVHAMCIERSVSILQPTGTISMIVPLALVSTQRMTVVQQLLEHASSTWYANFAWRPGKLFDTVNRALTIFVSYRGRREGTYSTNYQKWNSETRGYLFPVISYCSIPRDRGLFWAPKLGSDIEGDILSKLRAVNTRMSDYLGRSTFHIYYRTTGGLYWKVFTDFSPAFICNGQRGHSSRETTLSMAQAKHINPAIALLSSNLFWWWYTVTSNLRDINPSDIQGFPVPEHALDDKQVESLGAKYLRDMKSHSTMLVRQQKQTGKTETQCFKIQKSKTVIDEIDTALARHYGFTPEELDFIINYDIKYRMGQDGGGEEEA